MQVESTTINTLTNEIGFGSQVNQAVSFGHRADFSLLLAMLSEDARETEPLEPFDNHIDTESEIRVKLGVASTQPLASSQETYEKGAEIARQFHSGGIESARLQNGLNPDALAYVAENTKGLGEDVYSNLSSHQLRMLKTGKPEELSTNDLYSKLVVAHRTSQINAQV